MTIKSFINSLFLLFFCTIYSQKNFHPGVINLKGGTSIKGLIEFSNAKESFTSIKYKSTDASKIETLSAHRIESYKFDSRANKYLSQTIDSKPYLLEVLVEGSSNLLFLIDDKNKKRFFLKSDKSGLQELDIITKERNFKSFNFKRYIGVLKLEFNDCDAIQDKLDRLSFNVKSLSNIFIEYNKCNGSLTSTTFKSERLSRKNTHSFLVEAGINNSSVKPRGDINDIRINNLNNPINVNFGINYIYTPRVYSSKFSLKFGIGYNQIRGEGDYIGPNPNAFVSPEINLQTLQLKLGLLYNFNSIGKFSPTLGVYLINGHLLNKDDSYTRIRVSDNQRVPLYTGVLYEDAMKSSNIGAGIELGIKYKLSKKNYLSFKIGYEKNDDFLKIDDTHYASRSFFTKIGYSFDL